MAIEGTGIKAPSRKAERMAMATYKVDPMDKVLRDMDKAFKNLSNQESTGAVKETGRGMGDTFNPFKDRVDASNEIKNRPNFFSPGGGAFDSRNDVQVASADGVQSLSLPGSPEFKQEVKQYEQSIRDSDIPGHIDKFGTDELRNLTEQGQKNLEESYKIYRDFNYERNPLQYKQGTDFSKKEEKPSLIERTRNLAGSIFNTVTGTQPAAASQIPGGMPTGTQFTSSNLDAAKATTGDTSFASYRMAGQPQRGEQEQQGSGIVTPFSQTSMGKGEPVKVTPFSETSMGKGEPVKVTPFRQTSMGNKTVTVDGQKVAARQTVASLPSDYKQTEAREFAKAAAFQQAKRNPNVTVGVDSKGQPRATAVQKTRSEAGTSARTAEGNKARVQQNARARAQAAAINRKISGKSISQTKAANRASMRASAAARNASFQARKKAGTLSRSERTASGQRAANKAKARARAQAAAKARRARAKARKKGAPKRNRRRSRRSRRCDIFLKYNISPLTNMNLIRDDLAEVAYFVKELQA